MNNPLDLLWPFFAINGLFMLVSCALVYHLSHKQHKQEDAINELKMEVMVARDRVTHLYDQVNRVETKVDVQDQLQEIQEAIEEINRDSD